MAGSLCSMASCGYCGRCDAPWDLPDTPDDDRAPYVRVWHTAHPFGPSDVIDGALAEYERGTLTVTDWITGDVLHAYQPGTWMVAHAFDWTGSVTESFHADPWLTIDAAERKAVA